MPYLHITEKVQRDDKLETVTVIVEMPKFTFEAVGSKEGDVNVYVNWQDDQSGDMASWDSWADTREHFRTLLQLSEKVGGSHI